MFSITEDEDEMMIQLMQKSTRGKEGSDNTTIGFTIMKVLSMSVTSAEMKIRVSCIPDKEIQGLRLG